MKKPVSVFLVTFLVAFSTAWAQTKTYDLELSIGLLDAAFYDGLDNLTLPVDERPGAANGDRIAFGAVSSNDGERVVFRGFDLRNRLPAPEPAPSISIEPGFFDVATFMVEDPETWDANSNGTPDIQEIRCFQTLFAFEALPLLVKDAFDANLVIAQGDVGPSPFLTGLPTLFAFYMTLGDVASQAFAQGLCEDPIVTSLGCVFSVGAYDTSQSVDAIAAVDACLAVLEPEEELPGPTAIFVVDIADPSSWTRVTQDGDVPIIGSTTWTPDDQFIWDNEFRISVDTGLSNIAFAGATYLTTTRLAPGTNFAASRFILPQEAEVLGRREFITVATITDAGLGDFERVPDGFAVAIVALDLPAGQGIGTTRLSPDGSLLVFTIVTPSTDPNPGSNSFEPDKSDVYILVDPKGIASGPDVNEDGLIDNAVFSLSDPRIIHIRTTALDPSSAELKGNPRISEDNSLVIFAEDYGADGLGSQFVAADPGSFVRSDFDVLLTNADGSTTDGANSDNAFRFVDASVNTLVTDITPGGLRVLASQAPTGGAFLEIFLSTLNITTDFSGQVTPLPAGEIVIGGETVILTDSAVQVPLGDPPIVIEDLSGTEVVLPPGQIINFPEGTESSEITISTPAEPVDPAALPASNFALPVVRIFEPDGTEFFPAVEICITYTDAEVADIPDESLLEPFLFDPVTGLFTQVDPADVTVRDTVNNVICFLVDHFSTYAIGAIKNTRPTAVCKDVTLTVNATGMATVTPADIDGGSSDPDGDPLTLSLEGNTEFTSADVGTPQTVTLVAEDGLGGISRCSAIVTVEVDRTPSDTTPPVITLVEGDVTLECPEGYVEFGATALDDTDGDISGSIVIDASAVDTTTPGAYVVTYNVSDSAGNAAAEVTRNVTVEDTTPPNIISSFATPDALWPPNHKMIEVVCNIVADDACDSDPPTITLISITSNESDNGFGIGDGNTSNDIQVDMSTTPPTITLRSERAGKGDGRIYTLTFSVTDVDGNSTEAVCTVEVPHDSGSHSCDNPDCDLNSN